MKLNLSRKKLFLIDSIKYLGVQIDGNLTWKSHIEYLSVKLNRAIALLFKIRNLVASSILSNICFSIFQPHLNYSSFVWSQNFNTINRLVILQEKLLQSLTFTDATLTLVLYSKKDLKFSDNVNLENTLSVNKFTNNLIPSLFNDWFFVFI